MLHLDLHEKPLAFMVHLQWTKKPQCFTKVFCTSDSSLAVTTGGSAPSENGANLLDKAIECLLEKNFHMLKINDKIPEANKMYVSS